MRCWILKIASEIRRFPSCQTGRGISHLPRCKLLFSRAKEPAVSHVSFEAKPGETTAIIGSTGSGKTALVGLIPRFYDVQEGEVLVDGVNVKDYDRRTLRRKIGYVPQKALLFKGTIMEKYPFWG